MHRETHVGLRLVGCCLVASPGSRYGCQFGAGGRCYEMDQISAIAWDGSLCLLQHKDRKASIDGSMSKTSDAHQVNRGGWLTSIHRAAYLLVTFYLEPCTIEASYQVVLMSSGELVCQQHSHGKPSN